MPNIETIVHAENVCPEEREKFNKRLTVEEFISALQGGFGPILMSRADQPEENIIFEYVKTE